MDCIHNFKRSPGGLLQMRNRLIQYVRCERCGLIKREDQLDRPVQHPTIPY